MIELIRNSAVPANIMRSAAKGALALPPAEMIEILVYLTSHSLFGEQATMTLAGWDEAACRQVSSDPTTPREVLDYFVAPANRRPRLVPALLENPSVPEAELLSMAQEQSPELISMLLASARVHTSANVLHALCPNPILTPAQQEEIQRALSMFQEPRAADPEGGPTEAELEAELQRFLTEHAQEIAAEEGRTCEIAPEEEPEPEQAQAMAAPVSSPAPVAPKRQAPAPHSDSERISPLQRISQLTVGERVQLAMKGNKEERYILIRDGSKVVSSAVLESPKVTDQEAELFASLKNVQESVLRGIAGKRKFMKQYAVVRALVNNPRCPIDVQLTMIKNLLTNDLRAVSMNKNVSDTIRKLATKMYKERTEKKRGLGE